jgi:hypothetical protein
MLGAGVPMGVFGSGLRQRYLILLLILIMLSSSIAS